MNTWRMTIGLEIHAQLSTQSKLFSAAPVQFAAAANSCVSIVDVAMPGVLPVLNEQAVIKAVKAGLALNGKINLHSSFDRKHYSYPDLPQGYQITQFFKPIITDGLLEINTENGPKTITIRQIHIEQDAGKSIHEGSANYTYLDFNRCGVPLIEIVTNPDFSTIQEVTAFIIELRRVLRYIDASCADMEKGSLRCDANVSIAPQDSDKLGTRCEIKNLNSTRNIGLAIEAEVRRQKQILEGGGKVVQSTCLFDEINNKTVIMRSKEDAEDYFYLKDGDLPRVDLSEEFVEDLRNNLPELPRIRYEQMLAEGVSPEIAEILINNKKVSDFIMKLYDKCNLKMASNWLTTEIFGMLSKNGQEFADLNLSAENFAQFTSMIEKNQISSKIAKEILPKMIESGQNPQEIIKNMGYEQINDESDLEKIVDEVLQKNPVEVEKFRAGKGNVLGFFVGQCMKMSKGKGNPKIISEILQKKLN